MSDLLDYSGKFDPEFTHDKFSKKTLLKLLKAYSEYMYRIDGYWYLTVMGKWGNDEAFDCDMKVWEKGMRYEQRVISSLMNIQGNDIATVMKAIQASPWMWNFEYEIDMKTNDHAVITFHTCPTLFAIEKEGTGRESLICQEVEPLILNTTAHHYNPLIKVAPIKVPPRKDYSDCYCQWEFRLD